MTCGIAAAGLSQKPAGGNNQGALLAKLTLNKQKHPFCECSLQNTTALCSAAAALNRSLALGILKVGVLPAPLKHTRRKHCPYRMTMHTVAFKNSLPVTMLKAVVLPAPLTPDRPKDSHCENSVACKLPRSLQLLTDASFGW